ncbi:MAG TPA: clamp-binding protein CrfC [Scandinavium sp.]|jgi:replication fork clamp-binding protein CrfC|uniref:clamp-binding protein CrfC n=1 Tax=Scandinavium sp. TaxID=2830653 RepID=UPI002E3211C3|nr:clamp-binding protein CrfC [Scandinavium sp.]HEX4500389.1 clamp-binding protein CrfC [Scandinavium sp.]
MYTQTIFELSQEAERLLQLALRHLDTVNGLPGNMVGGAQSESGVPGGAHVRNPGSHLLSTQQDTLNNELRKITRLEMVLAIVGTMKAGKSTTINAIVGTEVLPNRNRPMTALPTLIRHTPGQKEPELNFIHVKPIERLMHELQERLHHIDRAKLALKLEMDKDMNALLERIVGGVSFEKHYLGAQPIFQCLKSLNDLVRLSRAMDVDFPFADYAAIEHIPVIEVEFVHLAGLGENAGQLTLLDTPGPNEAGQPHLQKMLNEQLARASAVLAVMDYTQLKSISDHDVRQAIAAVSKSVPLYALVNKFDQKDRNSDDEDQVRAMISGTLMKGFITPGRIFPVSSMWGYLANRARHELNSNGKLPDHQEQRWVQDFAEAALGRRWRTADLDDVTHIRHAADLLWEDSLFEKPINMLLHAAHANASLFALRSASHKLLNYAQNVRDFLEFRLQGLTVAAEQLQDNIVRLEEDMAHFEVRQRVVSEEITHEVEQAMDASEVFIAGQQAEILQLIDSSFSAENLQLMSAANGADLRWSQQDDTGELVLEDEVQANRLLNIIRTDCESTVFACQQAIIRELSLRFSQLETSLSRSLDDALKPIESHVKEELHRAGFRTRITLPVFQSGSLQITMPQWFNGTIATEDLPMGSLRSGMRETVSRWLNNPNWGWDDYVMTKTRYVIDVNAIKGRIIDSVSTFCAQILKALAAQVDVSVTAGMVTFFAEFSQSLSGLQKNLQESLTLRQQHQSTVNALCLQLTQCLATVRWIEEDARLLRDDIQTLFAAEQR